MNCVCMPWLCDVRDLWYYYGNKFSKPHTWIDFPSGDFPAGFAMLSCTTRWDQGMLRNSCKLKPWDANIIATTTPTHCSYTFQNARLAYISDGLAYWYEHIIKSIFDILNHADRKLKKNIVLTLRGRSAYVMNVNIIVIFGTVSAVNSDPINVQLLSISSRVNITNRSTVIHRAVGWFGYLSRTPYQK